MSLTKQFILLIVGLFLLVFVGSFYIGLHNTRIFLSEQLETHAQDTATSLGLSLTPHMQTKDKAVLLSMIDAIFDRGYYSEITLRDMDEKIIIQRKQALKLPIAPTWFVNLFQLPAPEASAALMSGWYQAGRVSVKSSPGYAYEDLWRKTQDNLLWYALVALSIMLLGIVIIRLLFRPLQKITRQAEAICNKEFSIQEPLPKTTELNTVARAMNRMVVKLKSMFSEQAELANKLRQEAQVDPVTTLGNRQCFNDHFNNLLMDEQEHSGYLMMIELFDLKEFNEKFGYVVADQLLKDTADTLQAVYDNNHNFYARIAGSTFVVLVAHQDESELQTVAQNYLDELATLFKAKQYYPTIQANFGIAAFQSGDKLGGVLSRADLALRQAQHRGKFTYHLSAETQHKREMTASQWRELIENALANNQFTLLAQKAKNSDESFAHQEIFIRLQADDQSIPASQFIPMAERFHLTPAIDRSVIEKVCAWLSQQDQPIATVINLSQEALADADFHQWIHDTLSKVASNIRHCLTFEVSEFCVTRELEMAKKLNGVLRQLGIDFALDQFGAGFSPFAYLNSLHLSHVKLDGRYTVDIDSDKDKQFFIRQLREIAGVCEFTLVAVNVETKQQFTQLSSMGIDTLQGRYLDDLKMLT